MNFPLTRLLLGLTLGLLLLTTSCKKDPDPGPAGPAFVGKTYRLDSFTLEPPIDLDGDGKADSDLTLLMESCELDNTIRFDTGGKISVGLGASKCPDDDPNDLNGGTWIYDEARSVLKITDRDDPTVQTEWEVTSAGASIKTVSRFVEGGVTYTGTMIWRTI
ncbi:hypothetical protein GO730_35075 [Spirosoma sp. HMF3257]|uniref:Lipocalin-like domain-containing protein n=1 Tax=Spirosoma telluris TaxID=2183553 RepID=A0A327NRV6_9BACT|nr:hypothetical protein [Spirosoma telluris]RAI78002.1 hypothetical protein HMF3257_34970 [Spirosoma telluris]